MSLIVENITRLRALPVTLVAVSKTVEEARLRQALAAGQRVFGENYVQEAKAKWTSLKSEFPDIRLHLIGHLQSNKADDAVRLFDRIDTLDRPSLVEALARAMKKAGRFIPCLLEVNIGDEPQKNGCAVNDVAELLAMAQGVSIEVQGLMCIPPEGKDPQPYFKKLAELAGQHHLKTISMGMSGDYEQAIACGATEVRLGSAIFGARA
ncbi:MAG: YggS family pyridoxal phosphate-dependent enzyme [Alphaproteobacteria bacterium]|nr:YggS family pyridoxal phosphate-dependent enzyme [Alphaproteobacteria bacterium]